MKKNTIIPECWEEMTQKQFSYLLQKVYVMMHNESITTGDVLHDFADYLCGRNRHIVESKRIDYLLLVNKAAEILNWIWQQDPEEDEVRFNYCTVKNLLPTIGKLVGPQDAGNDLKFGEYRKACWMYNDYTINHTIESLDGLVGILYRRRPQAPKGGMKNGDYREPFYEYMIEEYAGRVKRWPEYMKWGVYLWFGYFCEYLMTGPFMIEGNEISFAPLFGSTDERKNDESLGMTSVLFSLAESRIFGTINDTDNAPLFQVMMKLLADHITAKNLKKQ